MLLFPFPSGLINQVYKGIVSDLFMYILFRIDLKWKDTVILRAEKIEKRYNGRSVFGQFNCTFESGLYVLKGRNGCGKSTLLRILGGLDSSYTGALTYTSLSGKSINHDRAYLPDTPETYPNIKGREFIEMISYIRKIDPQKYIDRYRCQFSLDGLLSLPFRAMSLGQKKKLFATVCLIDEVSLWILDEPTNRLDARALFGLKNAIRSFSEKGIVIIAEHNHECLEEVPNLRILLCDADMAQGGGRS